MKYNETGIEVAFIENLLANTYIPDIPFGKLADEEADEGNKIETCYLDKLHIYKNEGEILSEYQFGKRYPNLTSNFISNNSYYTPDLHEAFGRYIKFYDDFYNIPVKGMYNCFSNRWVDSCCKKDNYKTFLVPIKWFHTYSIYLQSGYTVYARPIFFNGTEEQKVDEPTKEGQPSPITGLLNIADTAIFPTANIPEVYKVEDVFNSLTTDKGVNKNFLYSREDMLYLAVSVHNDFTGKIVVLEDENSSVLNKELLSSSVQDSIPYSSKLFSYIMDRVITPISNPYYITQLQEKLKKIDPSLTFIKGIFSEEMRNFLANLFSIEVPQLYGETVSDLTGYVDREIEEWLDNNSEALKTAVKERDKIKEYNYQYKYFWEDGTEFTEEEYSRVVNPNPTIVTDVIQLQDAYTPFSNVFYGWRDSSNFNLEVNSYEIKLPDLNSDFIRIITPYKHLRHCRLSITIYLNNTDFAFSDIFVDNTIREYSAKNEQFSETVTLNFQIIDGILFVSHNGATVNQVTGVKIDSATISNIFYLPCVDETICCEFLDEHFTTVRALSQHSVNLNHTNLYIDKIFFGDNPPDYIGLDVGDYGCMVIDVNNNRIASTSQYYFNTEYNNIPCTLYIKDGSGDTGTDATIKHIYYSKYPDTNIPQSIEEFDNIQKYTDTIYGFTINGELNSGYWTESPFDNTEIIVRVEQLPEVEE